MTAGRRRAKWRCLGGTGTSLKRGVAVLQALRRPSRLRSRSLMINRELGHEDHESENILRVVVDRCWT